MANAIQPRTNRRGCSWWASRILLGFAVLWLVAVVLILLAGAKAKSDLKAKYPPPGSMVDVGGYRLHLHCKGTGSPTVVMETGLGDPSLMWALVQPAVAQTTRTCSYDRAGLGWSDASPKPRTAENMVQELHALLTNAGVVGPYVLIGHSMGGPLVRLYAHTYPEAVVGMVLVDSSHEDQFARFPQALTQFGAESSRQMQRRQQFTRRLVALGLMALLSPPFPANDKLPAVDAQAQQALMMSDTKSIDTANAENQAFESNLAQVRAAHITTLGNIPLMVLRHGRVDQYPPDAPLSPEAIQQTEQVWQQMQIELAQLSPQGQLWVAQDSGHYIQLDQPHLVIDAIKQVLASARK